MSFETKSGKECQECNGLGQFDTRIYSQPDNPSETCTACHGLGWIPAKALTCGGGFDGPHHTADWMANDGPAVKVESVEEMITTLWISDEYSTCEDRHSFKTGARAIAKKLLSLTSAQLDALRKERA